MSFDVSHIRAQFPILSEKVFGNPLVYFDNAASVQKPKMVIEAMRDVYQTGYANVHRGLHFLSNKATADFEAARSKVADYFNAPSPDNIVFTSGGTDAINLVAHGLGETIVEEEDEIILTVMEHHANIVPWHFLRKSKGAIIKWIEVDADGRLDMAQFEASLSSRTRIVALTHLSNVLGAMPDIALITQLAHAQGARVLVDGCQAAVHGPVDVTALGVDYYVATGHKIYGPNGIGVLVGTQAALKALPPYRGGGEMIDIVTRTEITYAQPPHRFEAGTPPIMEAIALGAAVDWVSALDIKELRAHEKSLTDYAMSEMRSLNFVKLYGSALDKGPVIAFNIEGAHPHDVSTILDRSGVGVRAGHHCCQPLMQHLGVNATVRASFAAYNTHQEIDIFIKALVTAHDMLG